MSKPRDIHVGLYDQGNGTIHVWCVNFKIKGSLPKISKTLIDGTTLILPDREAIAKKEKQIAKIIAALEIEDE